MQEPTKMIHALREDLAEYQKTQGAIIEDLFTIMETYAKELQTWVEALEPTKYEVGNAFGSVLLVVLGEFVGWSIGFHWSINAQDHRRLTENESCID